MHCVNTYWVSPAQFPHPTASNFLAKPSIARTRTRNGALGHVGEDEESSGTTGFPLPAHVDSITSTSNPFVKHCLKLRLSSSYRHSHRSVLVVGTTPIREIYNFQESEQGRPTTIDCLLLLDKAETPDGLEGLPIRTVRTSSVVMKKLSGLKSTESIGTIALMKFPSTFHNLNDNWEEVDFHGCFPSPHRILVLDGIQDPGNLGTLIRSALAFRWGGVFLLPGCCDPFNEKALRASRGASFQLPIASGTWSHLEALVTKFHSKILAGHPDATEQLKPVCRLSQGLADSFADSPLCLVMGSEGLGLSERAKQACELVSIPMAGEFESLNVSVAGGIFLYMLQPQKHAFR